MADQHYLQGQLDLNRAWLAIAQRKREDMERECATLLNNINRVKRIAKEEGVSIR